MTNGTHDTKLIIVNAAHLLCAHTAISKDNIRYYLNGVFITRREAGGAYVVATDGHRMLVGYDNEAHVDEGEGVILATLRLPALVKLCKPRKGSAIPRWVVINAANGTASIYEAARGEILDTAPIATFNDALIDGTFPDFRAVVPQFKTDALQTSGVFSPELLGDFTVLGDGIRIISPEAYGPALVVGERRDFFGIVMPQRGDNVGSEPPAWW